MTQVFKNSILIKNVSIERYKKKIKLVFYLGAVQELHNHLEGEGYSQILQLITIHRRGWGW